MGIGIYHFLCHILVSFIYLFAIYNVTKKVPLFPMLSLLMGWNFWAIAVSLGWAERKAQGA